MCSQFIAPPGAQPQTGDAVPEVALVRSLRTLGRSTPQAQALGEELFLRCEGVFQRHVQGLRHRPELKEEALANMREHLWKTAIDPAEVFITQNFPHAVSCIAREEFTRLLRREGMLSRHDGGPRKGNVPLHVPRSLLVRLEGVWTEEDGIEAPRFSQLPAYDPYEGWLASVEAQRILGYLHDPLDRVVVFLRAVELMTWGDIAVFCRCSERTARLRYGQACAFLRDALNGERTAEQQGPQAVHRLKSVPPVLKRVAVREQCVRNNQERTERKRRAVFDAMSALAEEGKSVTEHAVLARARVSPSFLRSHPDLVQMIADPHEGTCEIPQSERGGRRQEISSRKRRAVMDAEARAYCAKGAR